jgi:hypothetical protein
MNDTWPHLGKSKQNQEISEFKVLVGTNVSHVQTGTCKVRNEIETKRNEMKPNETKRNQTKRNETDRNETK